MKKLIAFSVAFLLAGAFSARADLDLNGTWEFAFADKTALEDAAKPDFTATDKISVPGVFDAMPKWLMKKGTGLYRRTFTLERHGDEHGDERVPDCRRPRLSALRIRAAGDPQPLYVDAVR